MKVVTPFEVADCNTELLRAGVPCRVHLTDACGEQSLWLEAEKERLDEAHAVIVEFFEKKAQSLGSMRPVPTLRCSNERK